jgi:transcriptional regulator with XRE-family HTH domain
MVIFKSKLGEKLRKLRKEKNRTISFISEKLMIDLTLLSKIETGERLPTLEQLSKLAFYYNCNVTELKPLMVAEKIIKEYGLSEETQKAIIIVEEQIKKYLENEKI